MPPLDPRTRQVPPRALALSFAALVVPVVGALALPERLGEYGALLWLLALVPGFLLSYYRSWRGVATALAVGMAVLSITQAVASAMALLIPDTLLGIVVAYLAISMGVGFLADVFHRDRAVVEDMAFTDALTRLPNRRHAEVFLDNEFAAAERGRPLTVVLFDLDAFKVFNDTHGHAKGDEAIRAFADVLSRTTRRMNLSGRYGGEEFISVLAGSDAAGATVFAERVRMAFLAQHIGDPPLTVSSGIASFRPGMETSQELVAAADEALYQAKRDGRNCVRVSTGGSIMAAEKAMAGLDVSGSGPRRPEPTEVATIALGTGFGEGRRALICDGVEESRSLIREYLEAEAFHVVEAGDARSALLALGEEFDVVISSLRLPGASGHEVVRTVKERHPSTQVVVMTGIQDSRIASEALQAGADRYLFKPFGMPELQGHLVDALARRERLASCADGGGGRSGAALERTRQAREAVVRGTMALVRAVEFRDPYTVGHSARVAAYAACLADEIDPDELLMDRERLHLACELHDVGKIAVPDQVLNKTGSLMRDEVKEIHAYPRAGRRILEPLLEDELVLGVVNWHHERWDGGGYPDGLSSDAIPLPARVVAVADALDAMTCPRAYRDALPWDDAFARILADEGEAFDPEVVAAARAREGELEAIYRAAPDPAAPFGAAADGAGSP
jgi:diguanylate cyclase (GGDEF)-like protein